MMFEIQPSVPISVVANSIMTNNKKTNIGRPNDFTYTPNRAVGTTAIMACQPSGSAGMPVTSSTWLMVEIKRKEQM